MKKEAEQFEGELRCAFTVSATFIAVLAMALFFFNCATSSAVSTGELCFFILGVVASVVNLKSWELIVKLLLGLKGRDRTLLTKVFLLKSTFIILLTTLLMSFKVREAAFAFLGFFLVFFSGMGLFAVKLQHIKHDD